MDLQQIKILINAGESNSVEFKKCTTELSSSVFESICAFLNRNGGHLLIGISDNKEVIGLKENHIENQIKNLINTLNNPQLFNPTIYLSPEIVEIDGKKIIYLNVPESSQVHRYKAKVYDRVGEADNDITYNYQLVDNLHLKKRKDSSENTVYPYLNIQDFDPNTFKKMRAHIAIFSPAHPWLELSDDEMLRSAGFWRKDPLNNIQGFVLASVLLFGTENTILSCCPYYRTDAIYRNITYAKFLKPVSTDPDIRYDDRDLMCENLILSYSRLMNFVQRNLPDKFRLDDKNLNRIDLRNIIFREVVANLLVHREFTSNYPAKLLIFADRVITENWSKPLQTGEISLDNWESHTKNPLITKVFREMKWVEELGSGRKNIQKYAPYYFLGYQINIQSTDKFVFSITYKGFKLEETVQVVDRVNNNVTVNVNDTANDTVNDTANDTVNANDSVNVTVNRLELILKGIKNNPTISFDELSEQLHVARITIYRDIEKLKNKGIIKRIGPDKSGRWEVIQEK